MKKGMPHKKNFNVVHLLNLEGDLVRMQKIKKDGIKKQDNFQIILSEMGFFTNLKKKKIKFNPKPFKETKEKIQTTKPEIIDLHLEIIAKIDEVIKKHELQTTTKEETIQKTTLTKTKKTWTHTISIPKLKKETIQDKFEINDTLFEVEKHPTFNQNISLNNLTPFSNTVTFFNEPINLENINFVKKIDNPQELLTGLGRIKINRNPSKTKTTKPKKNGVTVAKTDLEKTKAELERKKHELEEMERLAKEKEEELKKKEHEKKKQEKLRKEKQKEIEKQRKLAEKLEKKHELELQKEKIMKEKQKLIERKKQEKIKLLEEKKLLKEQKIKNKQKEKEEILKQKRLEAEKIQRKKEELEKQKKLELKKKQNHKEELEKQKLLEKQEKIKQLEEKKQQKELEKQKLLKEIQTKQKEKTKKPSAKKEIKINLLALKNFKKKNKKKKDKTKPEIKTQKPTKTPVSEKTEKLQEKTTIDLLDEEVGQALEIIDNLLEKLPDETIDEFVKSDDFEIYEKVVSKYKKK
jgi:hypothetical protein